MKMKRIFTLILILSAMASADLAEKIDQAASNALRDSNLVLKNDKVVLYGFQTNGVDTKKGKYGCAKVVSITLRKAGVDIPVTLGVSSIETGLKNWKRVTDKDSLLPGDVVVWISRYKGNKNEACTGGGTCHVGIFSHKGYFHNNPLGFSPIYNGIGLKMGYKFKCAFRPPTEVKAGAT